MVQIVKNNKTVTALCSRCKTKMSHGGQQFGRPALKCTNCGWVLVPTKIVEED